MRAPPSRALKGNAETAADDLGPTYNTIETIAELDEGVAVKACASLTDNAAVCTAAAHGKMYRLDKPTLPLYTDRK